MNNEKNLPTEEKEIFNKDLEIFRRICAWCFVPLSGHDPKAEKISHGICQTCASNYLKESGLEIKKIPIDFQPL